MTVFRFHIRAFGNDFIELIHIGDILE